MAVNVLVVAAHPDDEVLGCAGTLAKHADAGDVIDVLILAEGGTARGAVRNPKAYAEPIAALRRAARAAADVLGVRGVSFGDFPDNRMDGCELLDVIKVVEDAVAATDPAVVYTHHGGDLNVDHRLAHQAVMTTCRPLPGQRPRTLMTYETVSSTEWADPLSAPTFLPTVYNDVTWQWPRKLEALRAYASEMRDFPHPRSETAVEALATLRGSACGRERAEAFALVRQVIE